MALHPLQLPSEAEKEANLFADCGQREQVKPLVVRTSVCVCVYDFFLKMLLMDILLFNINLIYIGFRSKKQGQRQD